MTPILIHRYLDANTNRLISPGFSMARSTNFDIIPVGALFAVVLHRCKGKNFEPESSGNVPTAYQASLADFTGTPIFAIKTKTDWQARATSFVASVNGYYAALTNLSAGRAAVAGILPAATASDGVDLFSQVQLQDANGNKFAAPSAPLPCWIQQPITTGDETGAPASPALYHGTVTIGEGFSAGTVAVTGLTTAALVLLQQKNTSNGVTSFIPTPTANLLTIDAGAEAPVGGWQVIYDVISL